MAADALVHPDIVASAIQNCLVALRFEAAAADPAAQFAIEPLQLMLRRPPRVLQSVLCKFQMVLGDALEKARMKDVAGIVEKCHDAVLVLRSGDAAAPAASRIRETWEIKWDDIVFETGIGAHDILGMGAFGVVRRAWYRGDPVAVKVLSRAHAESAHRDFVREVRAMSKMQHQAVVKFYGATIADNGGSVPDYTIVMERGTSSLQQELNLLHHDSTHWLADVQTRLSLMQDLAEGLMYMHRLSPSVVHGDIKASNVILTSGRKPKWIDFGLSNVKQSMQRSQSRSSQGQDAAPAAGAGAAVTNQWFVGGTLDCAAPEVLRRDCAADAVARDIYSFGQLMYEVLTLRSAWPNGVNLETDVARNEAVGEHFRILDAEVLGVPAAIVELVVACTQHNPANRPSADDVFVALRQIPRDAVARNQLRRVIEAVQARDCAAVEQLIADDWLIDVVDDRGNSPLHHACMRGDVKIADMLIRRGANVHLGARGGVTPLHRAAQRGSRKLVELLLAAGAETSARTDDGHTPRRVAELAKHREVLDLLPPGDKPG